MAEPKQIADQWHLTLSIHKDLWDQILAALLPIKVGEGRFHLLRDMRGAIARLEVRQRVRGLLEERHPPEVVNRARERAVTIYRERRELVHQRVNELLRVEGDWKLHIEQDGSAFRYGSQRVGIEARVRLSAEGKAHLVRDGLVRPFELKKFLAASLELGEIRYDHARRAVIGEVGRPVVDLGEHLTLQLASQALEFALEKQLFRVNPLTILTREQVEQLVKPAGGPLKLEMGVDNLALDVDRDNVTLKVRFGFTRRQIEGE